MDKSEPVGIKQVTYTKEATRTLRKIPTNDAKRIMAKINQYATNPVMRRTHVKKLTGSNSYRLRVGDWRVIFDEDGYILNILKVGIRGSIY